MRKTAMLGAFLVAALTAAGAQAQTRDVPPGEEAPEPRPRFGFVEAFGGFGFQFGETQYIPTADGGFKHPLVNGFSVGASAGWEFLRGLSLTGNWEYTTGDTRNGEIPNALSDVEGTIQYHTLTVGLRSTRDLGPGRLYGDLAVGVVLPYETNIYYTYAPAMSALPDPIVGEGRRTDEYNLGVGAYGALGYQVDLAPGLYLSSALRIKSFQSNNESKETELRNFVVDFTQPEAVNMTIEHDKDGPDAPSTNSVQDIRLQVALGYRL